MPMGKVQKLAISYWQIGGESDRHELMSTDIKLLHHWQILQ
jgi:hypothetical protein